MVFTFHYVSIKTRYGDRIYISTNYFTFHYVSIKTSGDHTYIPMLLPLHSTMSLLKLTPVRRPTRQVRPLHSTMSLLKLEQFKGVTYYCMSLHSTMSLLKRCVFTNNRRYCVPLHSTMSLLKPTIWPKANNITSCFTFHYVSIKTQHRKYGYDVILALHSTMSLLKLKVLHIIVCRMKSLHSTMSLLKQASKINQNPPHPLYIPLCLY